jgi:hypothetical protein
VAGACFTIEKFPNGYGWRLRDLDHGVIGASTEIFATRSDAVRDAELVRRFTIPAPIQDRTGERPPALLVDLARLELTRVG